MGSMRVNAVAENAATKMEMPDGSFTRANADAENTAMEMEMLDGPSTRINADAENTATEMEMPMRVNADAENTAMEMEKCQDPQPPIEIISCAHLWDHTAAGRSMILGVQGEKNVVCPCHLKISRVRISVFSVLGPLSVCLLTLFTLFSIWLPMHIIMKSYGHLFPKRPWIS